MSNTVSTRVISPEAQAVLDRVTIIQEVAEAVMKENEHYGKIPGCGDKPTLLKAGAEKLLATFNLVPLLDVREVDLHNGHREYRITVTVTTREGVTVGQGTGICSTLESKYRWRGGKRLCPECGADAIIKGKKEYGGGWLCFAKKGGCGAKWPDGAAAIESQQVERTENPDIADAYNTVLKMAKKRAMVDAAITATAASDFFSQDLEDLPELHQHPVQTAASEPRVAEVVKPTAREAVKQVEAKVQKVEAARRGEGLPEDCRASFISPSDEAKQAATPPPAAPTGGKAECDRIFHLICGKDGLIPDCKPICTAVWMSATTMADRLDQLRDLHEHVGAILDRMGREGGRKFCSSYAEDITGGGKPTPEQGVTWALALSRAVNTGEVLPLAHAPDQSPA